MTEREEQNVAKSKGMPWTLAKGHDTFCPISDMVEISDPMNTELWLAVNGIIRQKASTALMLYPVARLISALSYQMQLFEGDLVLSGTPEGVGPVVAGDIITAGITGVVEMRYAVRAAKLH